MEFDFYTFQAFVTFTKGVIYLIMAGGLIGLPLYWLFITGRDEEQRKY